MGATAKCIRQLIITFLCFNIFSHKPFAYNKGRIGGAEPSAKFLRENQNRLRYDRGIPSRGFGSSPFTPANYRQALYNESVFWDGLLYDWPYPKGAKMPRICTNFKKLRPESENGTKLGYFICPMKGEALDMDYCCGEEKEEYCCDHLTARIFYYSRTSEDDLRDLGITFAIIGGIFAPFVLIGIGVCLWWCFCRNR